MKTTDKILDGLMKLEEKARKLPALSAKEAEAFESNNIIGSVFYSNLLEGNTLSKEEAIKAMFSKGDGGHK